MRQESVINIVGDMIYTESGMKRAIGNARHRIGDIVFVDGGYVVEHERHTAPVYIPNGEMFRELAVVDGLTLLVEYVCSASGIKTKKFTPLPDIYLSMDRQLFSSFLVYDQLFNYVISGIRDDNNTSGTVYVECVENTEKSYSIELLDISSVMADAYIGDDNVLQILLSTISADQHSAAVKEYVDGKYVSDYSSTHLSSITGHISGLVNGSFCGYKVVAYQHTIDNDGKPVDYEVDRNDSKFGLTCTETVTYSSSWGISSIVAYYDRDGVPVIHVTAGGGKTYEVRCQVHYNPIYSHDPEYGNILRQYWYYYDWGDDVNQFGMRQMYTTPDDDNNVYFSTSSGASVEYVCHGDELIRHHSGSQNARDGYPFTYITRYVPPNGDDWVHETLFVCNPHQYDEYYSLTIVSTGDGQSTESGTLQEGALGPGGLFYNMVGRR